VQPIGTDGRSLPRVLASRGPRTPSNLRTAVARTGYPAYVVAAMAQISPSTMSYYINRHKAISRPHLVRLAEVLQVDEDWLWEPAVGELDE